MGVVSSFSPLQWGDLNVAGLPLWLESPYKRFSPLQWGDLNVAKPLSTPHRICGLVSVPFNGAI